MEVITTYTNELYHHGIKGQRWGVRRFQNKDGTLTKEGIERYKDDVIIKKGTEFQHITTNSNLKLGSKRTYLANEEWDKAVYAGHYALELAMANNTNSVYNYTFKAAQDLVSPSKKKRVDMFVDMYKKNPVKVGKELSKAVTMTNSQNSDMKNYWDVKDYKNASDDTIRKGYEVFRAMNGYDNIFGNNYSVKAYRKNLKKEGYNALIDDNDIGDYYGVKNPVIVSNGKKALSKVNMRKMSLEEMSVKRQIVDDILTKLYREKQ